MNWTEPKSPTKGVNQLDHVFCDTPLGRAIIEWDSGKTTPDYYVMVGSDYITVSSSLIESKKTVENWLMKKQKELSSFLYANEREKAIYFHVKKHCEEFLPNISEIVFDPISLQYKRIITK